MLEELKELLVKCNSIGLWDFFEFLTVVLVSLSGGLIYILKFRRVRGLRITVVLYKRQLGDTSSPYLLFRVKNASNGSLVISSARLDLKQLKGSPNANGDSKNNRYELKFRNSESENKSKLGWLLEYNEAASSYLELNADDSPLINQLCKSDKIGRFRANIFVLAEEKPRIVTLSFKLKNVQIVEEAPYWASAVVERITQFES